MVVGEGYEDDALERETKMDESAGFFDVDNLREMNGFNSSVWSIKLVMEVKVEQMSKLSRGCSEC